MYSVTFQHSKNVLIEPEIFIEIQLFNQLHNTKRLAVQWMNEYTFNQCVQAKQERHPS